MAFRAAACTRLPAGASAAHLHAFPDAAGCATGVTGRISLPIEFDHLGERRATVSYQLHGTGNAPPVVVLGGISAGRCLAPTSEDSCEGWWPGVVGSREVLDPSCRRLLGIDFLGGPTGDGDRDLLRPVTTRDQARALAALLDRLDAPRASLVGASYGGMVALAFAELFPERVSRLVVLCAAHRTHPMATAWRSLQRATVRLGVEAGRPADGLSLARALAMTTYRSAAEFEDRFSSRPLPSVTSPDRLPPRFPVEEYLDARGADFSGRFHPERFLALSESIDLHWTEPRSLPSSALLVSVASDVLVPSWLVDRLAERGGGGVRHIVLDSPFGHDAFLKEPDQVSAVVRAGLTLDQEEARR